MWGLFLYNGIQSEVLTIDLMIWETEGVWCGVTPALPHFLSLLEGGMLGCIQSLTVWPAVRVSDHESYITVSELTLWAAMVTFLSYWYITLEGAHSRPSRKSYLRKQFVFPGHCKWLALPPLVTTQNPLYVLWKHKQLLFCVVIVEGLSFPPQYTGLCGDCLYIHWTIYLFRGLTQHSENHNSKVRVILTTGTNSII